MTRTAGLTRARSRFWTPLLIAAIAVAGCRGDRDAAVDQGKAAAKENAIAKDFLTDGRYTDAKLQFEFVLSEIDGTDVEARFGAVLSELLQFVSIIRVISSLGGDDDDSAASDENEFLHALIDDLVSDLIERFDDIAFELKRLKADPAFEFRLDQSTPVYLTDTDEADVELMGEYDRGEVFLIDIGVQLVLGVLNYVQALDLEADFLGIFNKFTDLDIDPDLDGDGFEEVAAALEAEMPKIQALVAFIFNENPRFLGLDAGTGSAQLSKAGEHFGNAIDNLRKALFFASLDVIGDPDQSDDIIAYKGRADGSMEAIDPDSDLCDVRDSDDKRLVDEHTFIFEIRLGDMERDGSNAEDNELETSPETGCFVTKLMDTLLPPNDPRIEDPDARINLIEDVIPFVLGLVDSDIVDAVGGDVVETFIGNAIEMDFGPIFHAGLGPRDFLVAWDTPSLEPNEDLRLLWMELECAFDYVNDPVVSERDENYPAAATKVGSQKFAGQQPYRVFDRLFCREEGGNFPVELVRCEPDDSDTDTDEKLCDIPHFPGYNSNPDSTKLTGLTSGDAGYSAVRSSLDTFGVGRLGRDGVEAEFPAFAFQNPSFGGMLYLDVYNLADLVFNGDIPDATLDVDSGPGFNEATQRSLNAYVALLSKQLGGLIDLIPED